MTSLERRIDGPASRHLWVDHAKAIGIVLVVHGHVLRGLVASDLIKEADFRLVDSVIYSFHMPLFFLLSGLFLLPSLEKAGPIQLMRKKVDSIAYPYVLWSLLQGGIEILLNRYKNDPTTIADVLSFPWAPRAQFWFLHSLFLVFVIASAIFATPRTRRHSMPVVGVMAVSMVAFPLHLSSQPETTAYLPLHRCITYFLMGVALWRFREAIERCLRAPWTLPLTLIAFIAAQAWIHRDGAPMPVIPVLFQLPLATISILFVLALSMWLSRRTIAPLKLLGTLSMEIYLAHILAASGMRIVLSRVLHVQEPWILIAACTLGGLVLPILLAIAARRIGASFLYENPFALARVRANHAARKAT